MTLEKNAELQKRIDLASASSPGLAIPARSLHPEAGDDLQSDTLGATVSIETLIVNIAALAQAQQAVLLANDSLDDSLHDSVHDWDMMFHAVEDRLTSAVGKVLVSTPGLEPQSAAMLVQTIVLECVTALGQLHQALALERRQRERLEAQKDDAKVVLAMALANVPMGGSESNLPNS